MTDPRSIPDLPHPGVAAPAAKPVEFQPVTGDVAAETAPAEPPVVTLHGEPIHAITERSCIRLILGALAAGRGGWVLTVNTDILRQMRRDPAFGEMAGRATLRVADGVPLLWAAALQGTPLPERVTGSGLIDTLSAAAAEAGRSVFLLGGDPGTAEATAAELRQRYPNLRIAGTCCPPAGFEDDPREVERVREALLAARPEIVYVALGCPKQERLIGRMRAHLPGAWWLGVGIGFSYVSGRVRRAPRWMQRMGLEWVFRLVQEPRRLARRYLIDDVPFGLGLLGAALRRRCRPDGGRGSAGAHLRD